MSTKSSYIKRALKFLFQYFLHSETKWKGWLLLTGSILSIGGAIALGFALGWWCLPYIFTAFIAKELSMLLIGVCCGLFISAGMAGCVYLSNYLKNNLYVDWRSWLSKNIINQYLKNKTNYLEISRVYNDLDNPEQRIQEDIDKLVDSSLELTLGFIENTSNLAIYTVLLWLAGGTLTFVLLGTNIIFPGYLVVIALIVGGVTSLVGHYIGRSLPKVTIDETKTQSDLRVNLQQLNNSSEEIAIEHAERYHQDLLMNKVDELNKKTSKRLSIQNANITFNTFNGTFQTIFPILAAIPLYFSDLIGVDVFYSVIFYFSMVSRSLNWFINSFETINKFKTSLNRVVTLQKILDKESNASVQNITRQIVHDKKSLVVKNLELKLPTNNELVIKGLNLKFKPGIHTLIQAPSGTGKSSLFKAIAGTWLTGEGEIIIPKSLESIYFLPQKPTLPADTLRRVLSYPDANNPYSDEELTNALKAVNLVSLVNQLDKKTGFKSLGEQQRIAFARVLLRKPDWVFLDEATASLDEHVEEQIYKTLKETLPNTTIISIAHRSTVKQHHDKILFFKVNDQKEAQVELEHNHLELYNDHAVSI